MRKCYVYLKSKFDPILVIGYIGHKIRKNGFSIFYGQNYEYQIWTKDIEYFKIESAINERLKVVDVG